MTKIQEYISCACFYVQYMCTNCICNVQYTHYKMVRLNVILHVMYNVYLSIYLYIVCVRGGARMCVCVCVQLRELED